MKRVLVIGDVIKDVYTDCVFRKMCPDAPTVPAALVDRTSFRPGGAANVALNIAQLAPGVHVDLIGVVDVDLKRTIGAISEQMVAMDWAVLGSPLEKNRVSVDGELRLRLDDQGKLNPWYGSHIALNLRDYLGYVTPDLIVLSEYAGGTVDDQSLDLLLEHRSRLLVDTKRTDLSVFAVGGQSTLLCKLNHEEWMNVVKTDSTPEGHFKYLVVTEGRAGSVLRRMERLLASQTGVTVARHITHTLRVSAVMAETVDVCGCGDTYLAGMVASLLDNADPYTAMQFGAAAAATVVTKPRVAVADRALTLQILGRTHEDETL